MTSTELGTVVGERKPLARQALFLLATGVSCTLTGLGWLPSPGGSALDEQVNPQAKLDPDVHGRMSKWFQKQPMLTLVLEGRSGEVVSISLGAFRNQNEMLDAIRGRLQAAGGPPVEVVPA